MSKLTKKQKQGRLILIGGELADLSFRIVQAHRVEKRGHESKKDKKNDLIDLLEKLQHKWDDAYTDYKL